MNPRRLSRSTLVLASCLAACSGSAQTLPAPTASFRIYEHMFRHIKFGKGLADAAAAKGNNSVQYVAYYAKLANLTPQQADQLGAIALSVATQIEQQDAKAAAIIQAWRPAANAKPGQNPTAPAELATLQQGRNEILAAGQQQLQKSLGADAFGRLDQALTGKAVAKPATQPTGK